MSKREEVTREEENKKKKREKRERCLSASWGRRAERFDPCSLHTCEVGARKVFDTSAKEKRREEKGDEEKERREVRECASFARFEFCELNVLMHSCRRADEDTYV